MSDKKISDLTAATATADADLNTIVQGGVNKKITSTLIGDYVGTSKTFSGLTTVDKTIQGALNELQSSNGTAIGGEVFYLDDTTIIATSAENTLQVNTLTQTPVTTTEVLDSVVVNNSTAAVEAYLFNSALNRTSWNAGEWALGTYASVSATVAGASSLITNSYIVIPDAVNTLTTTGTGTSRTATISAGSIFVPGDANANITLSGYLQTPKGLYQITAYTSAVEVTIAVPTGYVNEAAVAFSKWKFGLSMTTGTLSSTSIIAYSPIYAEGTIVTNTTDKLGAIYFGRTARVINTTISYTHNGTSRYSHFHTSFVAMHNDLAGKQLANTGVTWGHIDDQAQTIYGAKTFNSAPILSTTGAGGQILYTAASGSKAIASSNNILWTGAGLEIDQTVGAGGAYFQTSARTGGTLDARIIIGYNPTDNLIGNIYHQTIIAGSSTLDIDARPYDATYASVMRFGNKTIALSRSYEFYNGLLNPIVVGVTATTTETIRVTNNVSATNETGSSFTFYQKPDTGIALFASSLESKTLATWVVGSPTTLNSKLELYTLINGAKKLGAYISGGAVIMPGADALRQVTIYNVGQIDLRYHTGTAAVANQITVTNTFTDAAMIGAGSGIYFMQRALAGSDYDSGRVNVITETNWTTTASTRNSKMTLQVSAAGSLVDGLQIASSKAVDTYGVTTVNLASELSSGIIIVNTSGSAMMECNQNNGTKKYTGYITSRQGVQKWFAGMDATTDDFIFRRNSATNDQWIDNASGSFRSLGMRIEGNQEPSTGSGIELQFSSVTGYVAAYNRDTFSLLSLNLMGTAVYVSTTNWNSNEFRFAAPGAVKTTSDMFIITNPMNAADMDNTGTAILFKQYYYDASPMAVSSGRIKVVTETDWIATSSTCNSSMVFQVCASGSLVDALTIYSTREVNSVGMKITGSEVQSTTTGLELLYSTGDTAGYVMAFNRGTTAWVRLNLTGNPVVINTTNYHSDEYTFSSTLFTSAKPGSFAQSSSTGAVEVLVLTQADTSEGFINFSGTDSGAITTGVASTGSFRVEINGVVRRVPYYTDA